MLETDIAGQGRLTTSQVQFCAILCNKKAQGFQGYFPVLEVLISALPLWSKPRLTLARKAPW
jgi:hypothetical protein